MPSSAEKDGTAREPDFDGVEGDLGFAFFGSRAGAVLGVGSVGGELGFGEWSALGGLGRGGLGSLRHSERTATLPDVTAQRQRRREESRVLYALR
jgi:hypothetical protein